MILNDKVYLGDTLLDLGEANGVTLEYAISDPSNMAAIFIPGSWTVNLPKSAVNLQAFGFMTEPGSMTDSPHKAHTCMVIRNGVPLFDSGKLTVIDVTDTINVVITWNTNDRLTALSGRKLRDLEITKVMCWDPSRFETSEDNDFKWVTDTGYKSAGTDGIMNYNARGFRPAVRASYLLAALLPGLTIGQTYWNKIQNIWLMLPTTKGNDTIDAALTYRGYGSYSNYDPVLNVRDVMRNFKQSGTIVAPYDLLINQSGTDNPFSSLYIPKDGRYRIFGYIRTSSSAGGSELYNGKFRLMLNLTYERDGNGALVENYETLYYSEYPINSNNVFDVTADLQAGDRVTVFNSYQLTNATISGDIAIDLNEVATDNTDTGYLLDYPIRENLPDIGCIDFITALFSMVALQAQTSGTSVKVFSIDDVINSSDTIDISQFINDRSSRRVEFSHGLTADNVLTYADNTDAIHFAANTYNKTTTTVVELPFTAGRDMALYRRDEDGRFEFVGEDTAIAISQSGTTTIRVIDDHTSKSATRSVTVSVFGFEALDWATLYGTYWQGYKGVFAENQRVVTYNAVLPESFIRTLDFSKPVHDGVNRFMLMKVSDYTYTGSCSLTMAMLDGVEVTEGILGDVILADEAIPLLFDTNVVALYNPDLTGTGKLIRELEETVGPLPAGSKIAVDLGSGQAKKWEPTFHEHPNKAFLDVINQGLSKESSVQFKDVLATGAITAGALNGTPPEDLPAATDQVFGVVKIDGVTIKIDPETGKIYAEITSGGVSSWNDLTDKPENLIAIAALTGAGLIKRNVDGTYNIDTTAYQTYDADLAAIAAIADGVGYLKRTGQNTWVIDTNTYLTSITKAMVEAVLTGNISTHSHSQYLTAITKTMVEAVLTGIITSHQHNYLPINGGNLTGLLTILNQAVWYAGNSGSKLYDWLAKNLNAVNVIADGAITAGSANGAIPDDLPAATDTLFGVIKLGLSLIGSAGIANIRNRNYTTLSTYTDAAARMVTSEIAIGSGTMVNTETISITLTNMPVSITKAPVGNIIANYSNWTGAGMKLSFARGGTYWLAFITNDLGTTITKDGIYISVQAMQLV